MFTTAAALGFRVFPIKPRAKVPAVPSWTKYLDSPPTHDELALWDYGNYNLGIATGPESGIVVIDADSQQAIEHLRGLGLPQTPAVKTAKGEHLYFRHPGFKVCNRVRIGELEIDVRGDRGYVVGAGSTHESGHYYEWMVSPSDAPFADLPQQILELLSADGGSKSGSNPVVSIGIDVPEEPGVERFLAQQLKQACTDIAGAEEGSRNDTLNRSSFVLAQHVSAAEADWPTYARSLEAAAVQCGLNPTEIAGTLDSAWRSGSAEPTLWVAIAKDYVYLGAQERFLHRNEGPLLKAGGFNGTFGHAYRGKGTFSGFLLAAGYITTVQDIVYLPTEHPGIVPRDGLSYWNVFHPSGVDAQPGDAVPFLEFMEYLIPDRVERDHLLKMMAFTVRNPGQRVRHALLLRSRVHGVGKSLLVDSVWGRLLGRHNVTKTSSRELTSPFQSWAKANLLVVVEELNIGSGLSTYNELKDIITADRVRINEKFLAPRDWEVFSTFVFISNLEAPLLIEPYDRRFFVVDTPAEKRETGYYTSLVDWIDDHLGVIRGLLDEIDLSNFNPHAPPPMTAAKEALIQRSCSPLAQELAHHIQERATGFSQDVLTMAQMRSVLSGHAPSDHVIGRALREVGASNLGQQRTAAGRQTFWAVRNTRFWECASPSERAAENQMNSGGRFIDWPSFVGILPACDWPGERSFVDDLPHR